MKTKKIVRWWHIPLAVLALALLAGGGAAIWLRSVMPWKNIAAMTSNVKLPLSASQRERITGGERDYSTLPEPLVMADGTAVKTTRAFDARRAEIIKLFETHVYGTLPKGGFNTSFELLEEHPVFGGTAVCKQVKLTVSIGKGNSEALLLLYLPLTGQPAPVVLGLNFGGNHTVFDDSAILPSRDYDPTGKLEKERGEKTERWAIEDAVTRGYGIATIYCNDFAPDDAKAYGSRVISLFDEPSFKAVGAWAFGLMRGVDYLVQDAAVDAGRIVLIGHSRLGKAALWAAANDARVALVISNDSGNTGASLSRSNHGETVASINAIFPHWFCDKYKEYAARENELPVDQNLLLASIAPRQVYVACAQEDLWADPQGAWNSLLASRDAFALYGLDTIDPALPEGATQPPEGASYATESMGYHVRSGWHDVQKEDWSRYLSYMDRFLK